MPHVSSALLLHLLRTSTAFSSASGIKIAGFEADGNNNDEMLVNALDTARAKRHLSLEVSSQLSGI